MPTRISPRMARAATVLSTVAALAGSALVFWAAATGDYWWAVWGGGCFAGAAGSWYVADLAAGSEAGGLG